MTTGAKTIELDPSVPPRKLARPDGFKTVSISVGIDGDVIRLLVNEESVGALTARMEQPGWASFPKTQTDKEYATILSITGEDCHGAPAFRANVFSHELKRLLQMGCSRS
jgi:hypothetical protein